MNNNKLRLVVVVAVCWIFLGSDCAGNGIPIRVFPPGEIVEFGTRKTIPLTELLGCGQEDGVSGFTLGQGTLFELGTLGNTNNNLVFSIIATAPSGADNGGFGHCQARGKFTVSVPPNQSSVIGNVDVTLFTNCTLSANINGYAVESVISLTPDTSLSGNNVQTQRFCYQVIDPGTSEEFVDCNEPISGTGIVFLTIRDFEFTAGVTYQIEAELTTDVVASSVAPELGGEITCTMSVEDLTVCLEPGGCNAPPP